MGTLKKETVVAGNYAIWPWESDYKPKLDTRKKANIQNDKKVFGGGEWEYDGTNVVFSSPNNSITVNNVTLTSLYSLSRNGSTVMDNIKIYDLSEG